MCSCLDSPDGQIRSSRLRFLKLLFLVLLLVSCSQLFPLLYHCIRLICYLLLDPHQYPPKPLPHRTSLFGVDLLKFDSHISDNASLLYVMQAVSASVCAILFGTLATNGLCREQTRILRAVAVILSVVVFFTAFGALTFSAMTPIKQIIFPLVGGSLVASLTLVFTLVFPPKPKDYRFVSFRA